MNTIVKKHGINIGLILGILLALITVLGYAFNVSILVSYWTLLYFFLIVIILGIVVIVFTKKELGGFISFKDAFTSFFIMLIIGMFISTLISVLILNVVDPDFKIIVKEKQIEAINNQREWVLGKMSSSSDAEIEKIENQFDEAIEKINNEDQYSIGQQAKSFFIGTAIMSIFGMLLALIFKRKDPSLE